MTYFSSFLASMRNSPHKSMDLLRIDYETKSQQCEILREALNKSYLEAMKSADKLERSHIIKPVRSPIRASYNIISDEMITIPVYNIRKDDSPSVKFRKKWLSTANQGKTAYYSTSTSIIPESSNKSNTIVYTPKKASNKNSFRSGHSPSFDIRPNFSDSDTSESVSRNDDVVNREKVVFTLEEKDNDDSMSLDRIVNDNPNNSFDILLRRNNPVRTGNRETVTNLDVKKDGNINSNTGKEYPRNEAYKIVREGEDMVDVVVSDLRSSGNAHISGIRKLYSSVADQIQHIDSHSYSVSSRHDEEQVKSLEEKDLMSDYDLVKGEDSVETKLHKKSSEFVKSEDVSIKQKQDSIQRSAAVEKNNISRNRDLSDFELENSYSYDDHEEVYLKDDSLCGDDKKLIGSPIKKSPVSRFNNSINNILENGLNISTSVKMETVSHAINHSLNSNDILEEKDLSNHKEQSKESKDFGMQQRTEISVGSYGGTSRQRSASRVMKDDFVASDSEQDRSFQSQKTQSLKNVMEKSGITSVQAGMTMTDSSVGNISAVQRASPSSDKAHIEPGSTRLDGPTKNVSDEAIISSPVHTTSSDNREIDFLLNNEDGSVGLEGGTKQVALTNKNGGEYTEGLPKSEVRTENNMVKSKVEASDSIRSSGVGGMSSRPEGVGTNDVLKNDTDISDSSKEDVRPGKDLTVSDLDGDEDENVTDEASITLKPKYREDPIGYANDTKNISDSRERINDVVGNNDRIDANKVIRVDDESQNVAISKSNDNKMINSPGVKTGDGMDLNVYGQSIQDLKQQVMQYEGNEYVSLDTLLKSSSDNEVVKEDLQDQHKDHKSSSVILTHHVESPIHAKSNSVTESSRATEFVHGTDRSSRTPDRTTVLKRSRRPYKKPVNDIVNVQQDSDEEEINNIIKKYGSREGSIATDVNECNNENNSNEHVSGNSVELEQIVDKTEAGSTGHATSSVDTLGENVVTDDFSRVNDSIERLLNNSDELYNFGAKSPIDPDRSISSESIDRLLNNSLSEEEIRLLKLTPRRRRLKKSNLSTSEYSYSEFNSSSTKPHLTPSPGANITLVTHVEDTKPINIISPFSQKSSLQREIETKQSHTLEDSEEEEFLFPVDNFSDVNNKQPVIEEQVRTGDEDNMNLEDGVKKNEIVMQENVGKVMYIEKDNSALAEVNQNSSILEAHRELNGPSERTINSSSSSIEVHTQDKPNASVRETPNHETQDGALNNTADLSPKDFVEEEDQVSMDRLMRMPSKKIMAAYDSQDFDGAAPEYSTSSEMD